MKMIYSFVRFVCVSTFILSCILCFECSIICNTQLDLPSKAYLADVVVQGLVINKTKLVPARTYGRYRYNVTVTVELIYKTNAIVFNQSKTRKTPEITIGIFGPVNGSQCIIEAKIGASYIFFLQKAIKKNQQLFDIASVPIETTKKNEKAIRRILCDKCGKNCCKMLELFYLSRFVYITLLFTLIVTLLWLIIIIHEYWLRHCKRKNLIKKIWSLWFLFF